MNPRLEASIFQDCPRQLNFQFTTLQRRARKAEEFLRKRRNKADIYRTILDAIVERLSIVLKV